MYLTVKDRLIAFLENKNISKSEFGRRVGVSSAFVTSMRKSIQPDKIQSIASEFPELNTGWLLTGEGAMLKSRNGVMSDNHAKEGAPTMIKDRVVKLIEYKGVAKEEFFSKIGITSANFRGAAKNTPLNSNAIENILSAFPDVNSEWLLTGEGSMLKSDPVYVPTQKGVIRYWPHFDASGGDVTFFDDMHAGNFVEMVIPEFKDCTDAVNIWGDSMCPRYKSGQIIILKEWNEQFIDYGNAYLVITRNGHKTVKYLRKSDNPNEVLCVSHNTDYDTFPILREDILKMYIVKGSVEKSII